MFPNLRAEMARKNMSIPQLAEACGIKTTTMYDKARGHSKITLDDALAIKNALEVDLPLEVLFAKGHV